MTKKRGIITLLTVVVLGISITCGVLLNNQQATETEKTLGQIMDEMNLLRDLKQECSDNLNIEDSAKFLSNTPGYCDSRDKDIESLRKQANKMQEKGYERALGLVKDR